MSELKPHPLSNTNKMIFFTPLQFLHRWYRNWRKRSKKKANKKDISMEDLYHQLERMQVALTAMMPPHSMPKATGFARTLQLLNLEILVEIDRICRKHNLRYWLSFGSALGAIRHSGFIPWDDDIDICMIHDDWQKFNAIAKQELPEAFTSMVLPGDIGRVCRREFMPTTDEELINFTLWKNQDKLFFGVDIFPVYWLKNEISDDDAAEFIWETRKKKHLKMKRDGHDIRARIRIQEETDEALLPIIGEEGSRRIFASLHCFHPMPYIWHSDDIFPLKEVHFEGKKFLAAKESALILWQEHGDFWTPLVMPTHVNLGHINRNEMLKLIRHMSRLQEDQPGQTH